jgi:hypothetical protein
MNIKINFEVTDEQYKDYEKILDDFIYQLNEIFIHDITIKEFVEDKC